MTKKIVVVEDNANVRENLAEILELDGYEVATAENGKIGVKVIEETMPDLILCDIMMPELDGYGVLHIINKKPHLSNIPFLFLTAKAEKTDFRKGMNLGADDYLTKPFQADELLNIIETRIKLREIVSKQYPQNLEGLSNFFSDAKAQIALEGLATDREIKTFQKKEYIFRAGKRPFHLFYVLYGSVKLVEENIDGKELITQIVKPNQFMGYTALIQEEAYHKNAVALEDCEICIIPKDDFLNLIYKDANVSQKFIKMLSNELKEKEHKLMNMAYNSVRKRVADSLVELATKKNEAETKQDLKVTVLREDLAAMVGTAKESAIRALCDIKETGFIKIEPGYIDILDLEGLKGLNW